MRRKDDRPLRGAGHHHGEVSQLDGAEARDVLPPHVRLGCQPVLRERRREPVRRALVVGATRHAAGEAPDEILRHRERGGAVERGRQRRCRQGAAARHGEGGDRQRQDEHERRCAHEAPVDGAFEGAAARSPAELSETSRLHCRAIVGLRQADACATRTTQGCPTPRPFSSSMTRIRSRHS